MNTTEVVSIIALSGTIASAALSGGITYFVTKRTVVSSEGQADEQRTHDSTERELDRTNAIGIANKQIIQTRIEKAYVAVQLFAQSIEQTAHAMSFGYDSQLATNALPNISPKTNAFAALSASLEVENLVQELVLAAGNLQAQWNETSSWSAEVVAEKPGARDDFKRKETEMVAQASATERLADSLLRQMRRELMSE
jgi:hypothetical protein